MTKHFEYIQKLVEQYGEAQMEFGFYMGKQELDKCCKTKKKLNEALKNLCAIVQIAQTATGEV